jgi:hypothetical protein
MKTHLNAHSEWQPERVRRPDAGGLLYAPVNRSGAESGHVPSYDIVRVQRMCDHLNARERISGALHGKV